MNKTELKLTADEAEKLASELRSQILNGQLPKSNSKNIELLIAGLGDKRGLIRRTFAESLGLIGTNTLPALQKALLENQNVTVRRAAAKTLKLVGSPRSLPSLLKALTNDPDPVVQGSAAGAMAIFGEKSVKLLIEVLLKPKSDAMQCGLAAWGLSFIGAEAPNALREAAGSKNIKVRAAAVAALEEQIQSLNDTQAKDIVCNAITDEAPEVRIEATRLLGNLNDQNWNESFLIKRLYDLNSEVRINAAVSLMKLKSVSSLNELIKILNIESDEKVRNVIQLAINKINN